MSRRVLPALAAAILVLGTAACGNEGEGPVTTPPPPVDNGPSDGGGLNGGPSDGGGEETEEPTAGAPDVPAPDPADYPGMDEETPEGAEQALRYYIAVVYWGYQTGDTKTLETLYTDNCEQCGDIAAEILNIHATGTRWESTSIQDVGSDSEPGEDTDLQASYGYRVSAHKEMQTDTSLEDIDEIAYTVLAGINWGGDGWIIDWILLAESYHAE